MFEDKGGIESINNILDTINTDNTDKYIDNLFKENVILRLYDKGFNVLKPIVNGDKNIIPGDFFIYGGSPGHVVLVLDIAINKITGKRIMLLGQSYMPSQEFHILKSYEKISPWYYIEDDILETPEWTFDKGSLMGF